MNLLPKSHKEFSEKDYWNKFFKKRGNRAFEWYGEYLELCGNLHKYIKQKDAILITGCYEAEEKNFENGDGNSLPVFIVIATKFKEMPKLILEVCMAGDKMIRLNAPQELQDCVKSIQDTAFITNGLAKTNLDDNDEVSLDLIQPGEETPRYTLYVVDQKRSHSMNKYAVFIVPQGRESEWLFGTPAGRRQLQDSAKFGRLVVAVLRRGHQFQSLDAVKEELTHSAKMLVPNGFSGQIPFLSLGSDVGKRVKVYEGSSKVSGDFVVEDVDVEGVTYRRLVFLDNQFLVQSEAKLKTVQKKGKTKTVIDFGHISTYHAFMCVGVALAAGVGVGAGERPSVGVGVGVDVCVLGVGGGGLCMFLKRWLSGASVTGVELDEAMLQVATRHFQMELDGRLQVRLQDGLQFLRDEAAAGRRYDAVMLDMDSKDASVGLSCPPRQFLEEAALADAKAILKQDGQLIVNLVCREAAPRRALLSALRALFGHVASVRLGEEVNEVVLAARGPFSPDALEAAAKGLNAAARSNRLVPLKCVDLKDFLQSLTILS
ncbi:unnamed protein product, partial [Iphiclides podalirius]